MPETVTISVTALMIWASLMGFFLGGAVGGVVVGFILIRLGQWANERNS